MPVALNSEVVLVDGSGLRVDREPSDALARNTRRSQVLREGIGELAAL